MDAAFWHNRWANNEIGWHERDFHPLLTAHFGALDLPADSRVFVPLCGKTRDIAWLLQQGYAVAGSELSELAVQQLFAELGVKPAVTCAGATQRYSAAGVDIFAGDIFALGAEHLGPVAAVYDRAALVALPPGVRDRYARHLLALTGNAPQLVISFEYDQNAMAGPPHSVPGAEVWQLYGHAYALTLAEARAVAGGLKGTPASEMAWVLRPDMRAMQTPGSARLQNSTTVFLVGNIEPTMAWYEKLGFTAQYWPPGFAILRRDAIEIFLQQQDGYVAPADAGRDARDAWNVYIYTDDVRALYDEFSALAGVTISRPLCAQEYGMTEFDVMDLNGHRLVFAQPTGLEK